jgi:hypothetical protein
MSQKQDALTKRYLRTIAATSLLCGSQGGVGDAASAVGIGTFLEHFRLRPSTRLDARTSPIPAERCYHFPFLNRPAVSPYRINQR